MAENRAAISIATSEPGARFSLRLRPSVAAEPELARALRLELRMNSCTVAKDYTIARLGPDEWLLLANDTDASNMEEKINSALAGRCYSLVDISHRNTALTVTGTRAREVINGGCPLDLHDSAFPPGTATRTVFGKAEIVLMRPCAEAGYRLEVWRSFAPYVQELLQTLGGSF